MSHDYTVSPGWLSAENVCVRHRPHAPKLLQPATTRRKERVKRRARIKNVSTWGTPSLSESEVLYCR